MAGILVGYPLDTVKVRIQTQDPTNLKYRGTFQCLSSIIKDEGVSVSNFFVQNFDLTKSMTEISIHSKIIIFYSYRVVHCIVECQVLWPQWLPSMP